MKLREQLQSIYKDYEFRSFLFSGFSLFTTAAFFLYNLIFGLYYRIIWNVSISIYYMVLLLLRTFIIAREKKWRYEEEEVHRKKQIRLFQFTTRILILMDLAMVIPISLMVLSQRSVSIGKIPAIAIAAYTTYKTVFAVIHYFKTRGQRNLSLFGLKIINLMDAIVSILTLQNTMVFVFGDGASMQTLTAYTSAGMLVGMIVITILLIRKGYGYSRVKSI